MESKKLFSENPYKIIISLISCVLWGSAFPVLKISYSEMNIAQNDMGARIVLAGMRFFLASILLFLFIKFAMKLSLKLSKKDFFNMTMLGLFQTALYYFLFYNGVANTTGLKASIIGALETFFTVIVASMFYSNDKIDLKKLIGLTTGFAGIILANWGQKFGSGFSFLGEGLLILSSLMGAFCSIFVKNFGQKMHPFIITAWQMFLGSLMLLLYGVPKMSQSTMNFTPMATGLLIYSAFLSAVAFSLWFALLKHNKAGEISLYRFMIPVSGAVLSAIFVPGEKFTIYILLSLCLVVLGIVSVNLHSKLKKEITSYES